MPEGYLFPLLTDSCQSPHVGVPTVLQTVCITTLYLNVRVPTEKDKYNFKYKVLHFSMLSDFIKNLLKP